MSVPAIAGRYITSLFNPIKSPVAISPKPKMALKMMIKIKTTTPSMLSGNVESLAIGKRRAIVPSLKSEKTPIPNVPRAKRIIPMPHSPKRRSPRIVKSLIDQTLGFESLIDIDLHPVSSVSAPRRSKQRIIIDPCCNSLNRDMLRFHLNRLD